ncbi:putative lipid II flippase FtsW [Quadrisphaera sp. DSM 44207]|uniref:putative lipid II flippase FtsW n=1 Tax=Quadrisphaera sp. DSM 44207 TaxID=1881057 RepID=UPI0008849715|nr:putative lipid II flippase FtsW [Quadrisphaera sp. DSM 44207]SDQ53588.1 cell division-specific peptidoglycan biosynthesis regulator FtsW [Quadrisphaera sp. DSM 44207]
MALTRPPGPRAASGAAPGAAPSSRPAAGARPAAARPAGAPAGERGRRLRAAADALLGGPLPGRLARWDTPTTTYTVLQGAVLLLVGVGLVMVLSSSSVESLADSGSSYAVGAGQAVFAAVGLVAMAVAARVPVGVWRRAAPAAVVAAVALQALVFVPGIGYGVYGNRNWILVGGFSAQPSEVGKVALVLWCAAVLARKRRSLHRLAQWAVPVGLGAGPVIGLVLLGRDLGTVLVLLVLVAGAVFVAGVPLRFFLLAVPVGAAAVAAFVLTSSNRMGRVAEFLSEGTDAQGLGYQTQHGLWALASGGWTGLGLGGSRQKWNWLPEAHNDFIFAIIGEELGLLGAVAVLALFVVLAWSCARVVRRSEDPFVQVLVGAVVAWVIGQMAINVAVVLGLLPVIGVPLPLISAGGSALVCTLFALGIVQACARSLPGARAGLRRRRRLLRRSVRGAVGRSVQRSLAVVPLPRSAR